MLRTYSDVRFWHKADIVMSEVRLPETSPRRNPRHRPIGGVAEAGFAIALAAMLSERPVDGTSIQSGAQHDGRD